MRRCPYYDECPLPHSSHPMTVVWRATYCERKTKFPSCARYKMAVENKVVPVALMPNGTYVSPGSHTT